MLVDLSKSFAKKFMLYLLRLSMIMARASFRVRSLRLWHVEKFLGELHLSIIYQAYKGE